MRIKLRIKEKLVVLSVNEVYREDFKDVLVFSTLNYFISLEFKPDISSKFYLEQILETGYLDLLSITPDLIENGITVTKKTYGIQG